MIKRTVSTSRKSRIDPRAEGCLSLFAIPASSVGNIEGHHDAIAFLEQRDTLSKLFYDAHILMACSKFSLQIVSLMRLCLPKVMPASAAVRPSYMCRSDPHIAA